MSLHVFMHSYAATFHVTYNLMKTYSTIPGAVTFSRRYFYKIIVYQEVRKLRGRSWFEVVMVVVHSSMFDISVAHVAVEKIIVCDRTGPHTKE